MRPYVNANRARCQTRERVEHFPGARVHSYKAAAPKRTSVGNKTSRSIYMKTQSIYLPCPAARRAGLFLGFGLACLAALAGFAKETPKLSVSDREVDRSARGVSYANVIKRVTPSVVTIEASRTVRTRQFHHPFMDDPAFRQFFGPGDSSGNGAGKMRQESMGSGVIVTEDGYLLTNNHVIEDADEGGVKIIMPDGKTKYSAKVVGRDP